MHELGPGVGRAGQDRPVELAAADDLAALADRGQAVATAAHGVQIVEQARRDRAGERDRGAALAADGEDPLAVPRRHVLERVVGGVGDPGALDPRVEPRQIDELRALLVGPLGDRADEPLLARRPAQRDDLSRLQVGSEVDGELGEACKGDIVHGTASLAGARMQAVPVPRVSWSRSTARLRPSSRWPTRARSHRLSRAADARRRARPAAAAGLAGAGGKRAHAERRAAGAPEGRGRRRARPSAGDDAAAGGRSGARAAARACASTTCCSWGRVPRCTARRGARGRRARDRHPPARRWARPRRVTFTVLDAPSQPRAAAARARRRARRAAAGRCAARVRDGRAAVGARDAGRVVAPDSSATTSRRAARGSRPTRVSWPTASARCWTPASGRSCSAATARSCSGRCSPCAGAASYGLAARRRASGLPPPGWSGGIGAVAGEDLAGVTGRAGARAGRHRRAVAVRARRRRRRTSASASATRASEPRSRDGITVIDLPALRAAGPASCPRCPTGCTSTPTCSTSRGRLPRAGRALVRRAGELLRRLAGGAVGVQVTVFDPDLDPDGIAARALTDCLVSALATVSASIALEKLKPGCGPPWTV